MVEMGAVTVMIKQKLLECYMPTGSSPYFPPPPTFYRFESTMINFDYNLNKAEVRLRCLKFSALRETPCGWWIDDGSLRSWGGDGSISERWVSKKGRKRYAYPTEREALEGYVARKRRQITILSHQQSHAEAGLEEAENRLMEFKAEDIFGEKKAE